MIPWVVDAKYAGDYRIVVTFHDGLTGEIDFTNELNGEIFEPPHDVEYFKNFKLEGHTLAWENGADFAPEYLRALVTGEAGVAR